MIMYSIRLDLDFLAWEGCLFLKWIVDEAYRASLLSIRPSLFRLTRQEQYFPISNLQTVPVSVLPALRGLHVPIDIDVCKPPPRSYRLVRVDELYQSRTRSRLFSGCRVICTSLEDVSLSHDTTYHWVVFCLGVPQLVFVFVVVPINYVNVKLCCFGKSHVRMGMVAIASEAEGEVYDQFRFRRHINVSELLLMLMLDLDYLWYDRNRKLHDVSNVLWVMIRRLELGCANSDFSKAKVTDVIINVLGKVCT